MTISGCLDIEAEITTTLYVLIPSSPLFAAHWSFFLPDILAFDPVSRRYEESTKGRRIHVSGDRLHGFSLEIVRQYDLRKHRSVGSRKFAIGCVQTRYLTGEAQSAVELSDSVRKDEDEGGGFVDNRPVDKFERICVEIPPPGPSLNKISQGEKSEAPIKRMKEVQDCQWWIRQVVGSLTTKEVLQPLPVMQDTDYQSKAPQDIVATLPIH